MTSEQVAWRDHLRIFWGPLYVLYPDPPSSKKTVSVLGGDCWETGRPARVLVCLGTHTTVLRNTTFCLRALLCVLVLCERKACEEGTTGVARNIRE